MDERRSPFHVGDEAVVHHVIVLNGLLVCVSGTFLDDGREVVEVLGEDRDGLLVEGSHCGDV